jgi:hypothetical protein
MATLSAAGSPRVNLWNRRCGSTSFPDPGYFKIFPINCSARSRKGPKV